MRHFSVFLRKVVGLIKNCIHQLLVYADVNILGRSVHTIKNNTEALVVSSKETGLKVNADMTKYMVMSRDKKCRTKLQHKD